VVGGELSKGSGKSRSLSDAIVEAYKTGALPHQAAGGGGSALAVRDEGVLVDGDVTVIDFVGTGVTASQTMAGNVEVSIPGSGAGPSRRGTTVERGNLGATLVADEHNGHPFYDTDLDIAFQWWEGVWYAVTLTPDTASVDQPVVWWGTQAEILPQAYKSGDRWIDTTSGKNTLRVCIVGVITNAIADWRAAGVQNNAP